MDPLDEHHLDSESLALNSPTKDKIKGGVHCW